MRILVDVTEPGAIVQALSQKASSAGIDVVRTILHNRPQSSESDLRGRHPLFGRGADYVVVDADQMPLATIERKTFHDLALTSVETEGPKARSKVIRQLADLAANPTPILILEGRPSMLYRQRENQLIGLQFWCIREGIGLMVTSSPNWSAHAVFLIARKLAQEIGAPLGRPPGPPPARDDPDEGLPSRDAGPALHAPGIPE